MTENKIQKRPAGENVPLGQLYHEILNSDFDSITLRHIKNEAKLIIDGRSDYARKTGKIRAGNDKTDEILASAALLCRADETAGTVAPRGSYEGERECGRRQERLIRQWAEAAGCWYDLSNLKDLVPIGSGGESEVFRLDGRNVVKINSLHFTVSPQLLLERVSIHNALFPSTRLTLLGFGTNMYGEFCAICKQPYVKASRKATQQEIENFLSTVLNGAMEPYRNAGYNYKNEEFLLDDFHDENVLVDSNGRFRVIDSDIRFNYKNLGFNGKVVFPSVEEEIRINAQRHEKNGHHKDKAMKETKIKDTENSVHLEGPINSCRITELKEGSILAQIEICTAARHKEDGKTKLVNPIFHHVAVVTDGENAERLRKLSTEASPSDKSQPGLSCTAVIDGQIAMDKNGQPFVQALKESFRLNDRISFKNTSTIKGIVREITYNDAYAGIILECKGPGEKPVLVPVTIYSKHNQRKYADLASGKVKTGDTLEIKGPLISGYYSNGEKEVFRCHVNINTYKRLTLKKEQARKGAPQIN